MNPSARLQAALELIALIDITPRPADALVSGYFRSRRYIGSKDRAAVATMTYDVLRHLARLDWWVEKICPGILDAKVPELDREAVRPDSEMDPRLRWDDSEEEGEEAEDAETDDEEHSVAVDADIEAPPVLGNKRSRLRLLAFLRLVEGKSVKFIDELCDNKKFSPDSLNEEERRFLRQLEGHTLLHPSMPDTVTCECPEWAATSLRRKFGKNFAKEMNALLRQAPLDLRINPLKTTRERAMATMKNHDLVAKNCPYSPFGLRLHERPALNRIALLKDGVVEIQDEGSQLVALLVDAKPGQRVVDFCAGAGGKTLAIAAQMQNKGRITACDVLANRLKRSAIRFRRAGLHNIEVKPLSTERDPWVKKHKASCDRVLVDAPCSGTGTWRRNPDARWRSLGPGLAALVPLQASILDNASRLVRPGGRLIYATCSLLPEENELQIEAFLVAHPEFQVIPVQQACTDLPNLPDTGPYLSLTPAQHNTDGFFAAVMERAAAVKVEETAA